MIQISVEATSLDDAVKRKIPLILERMSIRLAGLTAEKARSELPQRFSLKSSWPSKGFRYEKISTVPHRGPIEVIAYHRDTYMKKQEGATVRQRSHHLSVPSLFAQRTPSTRFARHGHGCLNTTSTL